MFLLIREMKNNANARLLTLNSIMFLLILSINLLCDHLCQSLNSIMFLLIQASIDILIARQKTLNSIMFLLIPDEFVFIDSGISFKFHYVSINSREVIKDLQFIYPLNSIMFLLIRFCSFRFHFLLLPLNSIMFLLILFFRELLLCYCPFFKFHYVSINSRDRWWSLAGTWTTLNSIMFLLIPDRKNLSWSI